MIAVDTETTGLDFYHGAKPFLVTTCRPGEVPVYWEWPVDPVSRQPIIPESDLQKIKELIYSGEDLVLQNTKFDVTALRTIIPDLVWPWERTYDTLLAEHILNSNQLKSLDALAIRHLGVNIRKYENTLGEACNKARMYARKHFPNWRIAEEGLEDMPSAKSGQKWKTDMWLLRAVIKHRTKDMPRVPVEWETLCSDYANMDSEATGPIFQIQFAIIKKRNLEKIYRERLKGIEVGLAIETYGLTFNEKRAHEQIENYGIESQNEAKTCVDIAKAKGYELKLPKSGNNKSLTDFVFGVNPKTKKRWLDVPVLKVSEKTGVPSLDAEVFKECLLSLPANSEELRFLTALSDKRKRDTAISYMQGYKRFSRPTRYTGFSRLHPNLNQTGTNTLRWSSSNPNEQNISKKKGFNLRYLFGPLPDREWFSLDYKNVELRIPAYESGEEGFIALFERPDDPPYFGSNHLMTAHIVFPREFEGALSCTRCGSEIKNEFCSEKPENCCQCTVKSPMVDGRIFKKRYESSLYTQVKRGNFAITCGAVPGSGTADKAFGKAGAQLMIMKNMKAMADLSQRLVAFARRTGYVETMPDKTVDPDRGYPIQCQRSAHGKIVETTPFSYHVSGTAMWETAKAMVRCYEKLQEWNKANFDGHIIVQGHDELIFDFPRYGDPVAESVKVKKFGKKGLTKTSNYWRIKEIQRLMELSGDDIGVPTPVSCEYHTDNWSQGVSI